MKPDSKPPKLYVIDPTEESRVPFLRGILTRSLQNAGMSFPDAYRIANEIRQALWAEADIRMHDDEAEISTKELKRVVLVHLAEEGEAQREVSERFERGSRERITIQVRDPDGQPQPFSKGQLSQNLETCALSKEESYAITTRIEQHLIESGRTDLASSELSEIVHDYLSENNGPKMAHRYRVWTEFARSGRPLILLIGGTTGSGKSTISSEIAHRLNIARTQSTDMLREVMRLLIPPRLLPTLHASSYNAWESLPTRTDTPVSFEANMIDGYLTQAEQVGVGIAGVMQRARREQIALILEGVHIYPALQNRLMESSEALVVPLILAVIKPKQLRKRLKGRGQLVASRRAERYMENFNAIWQLQSFLLSEADRYQIPIIDNGDQEDTIRAVMEMLSEVLIQEHEASAKASLRNAEPEKKEETDAL